MTIFRKRPVQRMYAQDPQLIPGGALHDSTGGVLSPSGPVQTSANTGYGMKAQGLPDSPGFGDYAKAGLSALGGFGAGPASMVGAAARAALDPASLNDTGQVNVPGIGNITTAPGAFGPLLDVSGFGALARVAGVLNARNLANIMANDPRATAVSGPGYGGAFSNGTFNGTLPGGLEASTRRAMVHEIAKQHYDRNRDNRGDGRGGLGDAGKDRSGEQGSHARKDH